MASLFFFWKIWKLRRFYWNCTMSMHTWHSIKHNYHLSIFVNFSISLPLIAIEDYVGANQHNLFSEPKIIIIKEKKKISVSVCHHYRSSNCTQASSRRLLSANVYLFGIWPVGQGSAAFLSFSKVWIFFQLFLWGC